MFGITKLSTILLLFKFFLECAQCSLDKYVVNVWKISSGPSKGLKTFALYTQRKATSKVLQLLLLT